MANQVSAGGHTGKLASVVPLLQNPAVFEHKHEVFITVIETMVLVDLDKKRLDSSRLYATYQLIG